MKQQQSEWAWRRVRVGRYHLQLRDADGTWLGPPSHWVIRLTERGESLDCGEWVITQDGSVVATRATLPEAKAWVDARRAS
jgi:hypothetical protein